MKMSEIDEAELRVETQNMYNYGGVMNVLACVDAMQKCQLIIMLKLNEILEEEAKK